MANVLLVFYEDPVDGYPPPYAVRASRRSAREATGP